MQPRFGPTIKELAEKSGETWNAIRCRIRRRLYRAEDHGLIGANGKPVKEIDPASLPPKLAAWWAEKMKAEAEPFDCAQGRSVSDSVNQIELSAEAREEMLQRERIVIEARRMRTSARSNGHSLAATRREALQLVAKENKISFGTLYRWMAAYDQGGLSMLAPQNGKGHRGRMKFDAQVQGFIQSQYLSPKQPKISTVYARTKEFALSNDLPAPSYAQIRRFVYSLPDSVVLYHRLGPEAWRHQSMPKETRDLNATPVGEWYVGDHRVFDLFVKIRVKSSVDRREGGWRIFRPWVSAWQDIGSRDLVGWHINEAPNSTTIACAARKAILTYGRPKHWYYDNGKDYRSHYLSGKGRSFGKAPINSDTEGIFKLLGSETHLAKPYTPWSKPIERLFGYMTEWEKTLPGWCGKDNKERPEKLEAEIKAAELLTFEEFTAKFSEWAQTYRTSVHGELRATPASKWEGVTREIPDARALDLLLMERKDVRVYTSGIHMHGVHFWADELSAFIGGTLTVRYDRNEIGRLYVYRDRKFLCEAVNNPFLRMNATQAEMQEAARKKVRAKKMAQQLPEALVEAYGQPMESIVRARAMQIREEESAQKAAKIVAGQRPSDRKAAADPKPSGPIVPLMTKFDGMAKEIARRRNPAFILTASGADLSEPAPTPTETDYSQWLIEMQTEERTLLQSERSVMERREHADDQMRSHREMIEACCRKDLLDRIPGLENDFLKFEDEWVALDRQHAQIYEQLKVVREQIEMGPSARRRAI